MRPLRSLSSAAVALAVLGLGSADATPTNSELRLNGWFPCGFSSSPSQEKPFECAEVDVPLCYDGVCDSDRTISLFVKRLVASATQEAEVSKSLWMLQGGPGGSSVALETSMLAIQRQLKYQANLYTVDHRGTGRSFFLQCDAAQAFTSGSPSGVGMSVEEVPNCLRDALFQIDNQTAAFSVTSAAKDVEFLVNNLNIEDDEVYIYGASYGTYWTERVMHLAPAKINGYVLDGVVAEDDPSKPFTGRNTDNVTPVKLMAQYCEQNKACASMFGDFKKGDLYSAWLAIYDDLDALEAGKNRCADLFRYATLGDTEPLVSTTLKRSLASIENKRVHKVLLPGLLRLVHRCKDDKDFATVQTLKKMMNSIASAGAAAAGESDVDEAEEEQLKKEAEPAPVPATARPVPQAFDVIGGMSSILSHLIKPSELWPSPSPSWANESDIYYNEVFPQPLLADYTFNCLFNGDLDDPSCDALDAYSEATGVDLSDIEPVKFTYETDQYYEQFATIPDHASVLIINGKLDFQTMSENGVREYENLEGGRGKMMVEMDYGGHCSGLSSYVVNDTSKCGYRIIASFVEESGDVEKVATSCMAELPELQLWPADLIVQTFGPKAAAKSESQKATKAFRHGK